MKKQFLIAGMLAGTIIAAPFSLQAGGPDHHPRHHSGGSGGVRLAADIVNLVRSAVEPRTTIVVTPPEPPRPAVVVTPPAPRAAAVVYQQPPAVLEYRYYNGSYVVYENGWYWYGSNWIWGGHGTPLRKPQWHPAPPRPNPPNRYYRYPAPPRPHYRTGGHHHR